MSVRRYRLESALERVLRVMNLRRPQRESLEKVHQIVVSLGRDLPELSTKELCEKIRDQHPIFDFSAGFPQFTFDLATGVGKTRLMGALVAYLYLGGQSRHFLILAPRAAILRKMESECVPTSAKYLFVDPALVPEPRLWYRGNLETFEPDPATKSLIPQGPVLAVLSPQALTGDDKRANTESEFSGVGFAKYMASAGDLIVLMDEAHHLGRVLDKETKAWTRAVRDLNPSLQLGMTATPRDEAGVNVLYRYDLRTCLKEKLYTKDVRLVVRRRDEADHVSDEEWDHHTIDFALERLRRKERSLREYAGTAGIPPVRPVLLICADRTANADAVAEWLIAKREFSADEVLVTHSEKAKTEEELQRLVDIEKPASRVRVVVNVAELTEGWDVTNVFVIAPLRSLATFQAAVQTMGRGLRLPAGRRVDDTELDTLDVLCFGRQSLTEILKKALEDYGDEEDKEAFVKVADSDDPVFEPERPTKMVVVAPVLKTKVHLPEVSRKPIEPDLDFDVSTMKKLAERGAVEFDLTSLGVAGTAEALKYDFDVFVRIATARVMAGLRYLSDPLHRQPVERLIERFLAGIGRKADEPVGLDWVQVAELVKEAIDGPYRRKEPSFTLRSRGQPVAFGEFKWRVPEDWADPIQLCKIKEWDSVLSRLPIAGWRRCAYESAAFDTQPEFDLARILDASAKVVWWHRNDPARLRISTPIGNYEPDFLCSVRREKREMHAIVEVKQSGLWSPSDSDPRVKARSADAWCDAVNSAEGEVTWEHIVVLDKDVGDAASLEDLKRVAVNQTTSQ